MNISKIEITNVKGIGHAVFELDLNPNKPNIMVAPNGFGKSSFTTAFDSLRQNKIELDSKNYHRNNQDHRPSLTITLSSGTTLTADDNTNTISEYFDVFVINNQTEPKSIVQRFAGRTFAKTSLDILPTTLVQTIPKRVDFEYSSSAMKSRFGVNGGKLLTNISSLFSYAQLFQKLEEKVDFSRFDLKGFEGMITEALASMNAQTGKAKELNAWCEGNILDIFRTSDEFRKLSDIIRSFGFPECETELDCYLAGWQINEVRKSMGANYRKACKYLFYLDEKAHYTDTIAAFNPVKDRFDIQPRVEGSSLVINWPKAHEISNGQRDILTFIALMFRARRNFKKKDCILVIDEIFDYMDDANLISFQYYISTFIDEMKRLKRRIFPILLTHLDPLFFNHFCFNDNKIKVNYLKKINIKTNQHILKIIYKRDEAVIKANVDAYFFHFHPTTENLDFSADFASLRLNVDWAKPQSFLKKIFREVRRYLYETDAFDPLAVCFGLRIKIEELIYSKLPDAETRRIFIEETNGTKNKLHFAHGIGIDIPETYFLLGIIYNTSLHLSEGQDVSRPLGLKLENGTIKKMIKSIFERGL